MSEPITPTRFLVGGLQFFSVAIAVALALTVLAPIGSIRGIAALGLACAATGLTLEFLALRKMDPHTLSVLDFRTRQALGRARATAMAAVEALRTAAAALLSKTAR